MQIYTKITKNINSEILANVPAFLQNENFLGLGSPVGESGTPAYLRSLKCYQSISRPEKPREPNFLVILTLSWGFTVILRFFRINFHGRYLHFVFPQLPFHGKSISSYSFQNIGMRFSAFNTQMDWLQNVGSGILNFCPKKFLEPSKVKIIFFKIFFFFFGGL